MPLNIQIRDDKETAKNLIHYFTKNADDLRRDIPLLKREIETNGMILISWPKKASKIATDITEDVIRDLALSNGLVDIKVCAIDEIWSGLKLVIPVKDRVKKNSWSPNSVMENEGSMRSGGLESKIKNTVPLQIQSWRLSI